MTDEAVTPTAAAADPRESDPDYRRATHLPTWPEDGQPRAVRKATPVGPFGTGGETGAPKTTEIQPQVAPEGVRRQKI